MSTEPGNAELDRVLREGFANVNARLDKLVSHDVFEATMRRVDERAADLQADIAQEKLERVTAIKDEKAEREKLSNRLWMVAASICIPVGLFLANLFLGK